LIKRLNSGVFSLRKKGSKKDKQKSASTLPSEHLKNFESNLKDLESDDLIKKYLGEDKHAEEQLIDKYFGHGDEDSLTKGKTRYTEISTLENQRTEFSEKLNSQRSPLGHMEFAAFLDEQKKKMAKHEKHYPEY